MRRRKCREDPTRKLKDGHRYRGAWRRGAMRQPSLSAGCSRFLTRLRHWVSVQLHFPEQASVALAEARFEAHCGLKWNIVPCPKTFTTGDIVIRQTAFLTEGNHLEVGHLEMCL